MNNPVTLPENRDYFMPGTFYLKGLPARTGPRPKTLRGPLHIQCEEHGDPRRMHQLMDDVLSWPYIESLSSLAKRGTTIPIRLQESSATNNSEAFMTAREFARVLLAAPTIYLTLPLVSAHWAIVRGWAEPHYLRSFGLMPAGTVVVYTPRDKEELSICYSLFLASYHFACKPRKDSDFRRQETRQALAIAV